MIGSGLSGDVASAGIALFELLPEAAVAMLGGRRCGCKMLYRLYVRTLIQVAPFKRLVGAWGGGGLRVCHCVLFFVCLINEIFYY